MAFVQPAVRVGDAITHESVVVFPLFTDADPKVDYRLGSDAVGDGSVVVEEVSESGSVPDLMVENKGDLRVLFLEGEQLVGAKQDRVLNTSVLIPARSKTKIPVSCVEQGRWGYRSRQFASSDSYLPSSVRAAMKASVSRSVRDASSHRSDQRRVWESVYDLHQRSKTRSSTGAMEDAFVQHRQRLDAFRSALGYVEGASGLALAVGGKLLLVDLYDRPDTCEKVWPRIVAGAVFDAMAHPPEEARMDRDAVEQVLAEAKDAAWHAVETVGEGTEYRSEVRTHHGSALTCEDAVVHESVI